MISGRGELRALGVIVAEIGWERCFGVSGGLLSDLGWTFYGFFVYKCDRILRVSVEYLCWFGRMLLLMAISKTIKR